MHTVSLRILRQRAPNKRQRERGTVQHCARMMDGFLLVLYNSMDIPRDSFFLPSFLPSFFPIPSCTSGRYVDNHEQSSAQEVQHDPLYRRAQRPISATAPMTGHLPTESLGLYIVHAHFHPARHITYTQLKKNNHPSRCRRAVVRCSVFRARSTLLGSSHSLGKPT